MSWSLLRGETPTFDEIVVAQIPVDEQDRVLHDELTMRLQHIVEQRHFHARRAVIENEAHAIGTTPDFQHQPRHRNGIGIGAVPATFTLRGRAFRSDIGQDGRA